MNSDISLYQSFLLSNMRILIISVDDWEALYIDGKLIDEGHRLGDGDSRLYMLRKAEEYGFESNDVYETYATDEDIEEVNNRGSFPEKLSDLKGNYIL